MKYKLLRFSLLSIFAMLWGTVFADYEKVTSTSDLTSGDYLIVYESGSVAFNGALETLDAVSNTVDVEISNGKITSSTDIDAAIFTIDTTNGTVTSASGYYIGVSANSNGLKQTEEASTYTHTFSIDDDGNAVIKATFEASTMTLRYNTSSGQERFRYYKNSGQQAIQLYKKVSGETPVDNRVTTTIELGEATTSAEVGATITLPSFTVKAGDATVDAIVTWTSSNESIAIIEDNQIKALAAGTTTITATYDGDGTYYKGSTASFTLTVTAAPYTSFADLQASATTTSTPVTIQFNGQQVVFVSGVNAFLADSEGYGLLIYTNNHGLEAGQVLNGTINCNLTIYQGNTEITNFSKGSLDITTATVTPVEKTIADITKSNQSTLVTLKNVTYDGTTKKLISGNDSITFYDKFKTNVTLADGIKYDITGIVIIYNNIIEIAPRTADDIVATEEIEERNITSITEFEDICYSGKSTICNYTFSDLLVTFQSANHTYVTDGNRAMMMFGPSGLQTGQRISGTIRGTATLYLGTPELSIKQEDINVSVLSSGNEVTHTTITAAQLQEDTKQYMSQYVSLENVRFETAYTTDDYFRYLEFKSDGKVFRLFNLFNRRWEIKTNATYTLDGMVGFNKDTIEIAPMVVGDLKLVAIDEPVGFRDIKADLTQLQALATESEVFIKVAEDGTISQAENAEEAAATLKGKWHSTSYGWSNFTASVPVEGCVKITYATHDYGNDIIVTNSAGAEIAKFNTQGAKWSSDPNNVVVAYYRTNEPTTLNFSNANYNPYFAVEAIDEADLPAEVTNYTITFAAGEGVTGIAPAAIEVEAGSKFTAPINYTLYKEGYTLTGWTSGDAIYLPGQEITPEADMTLNAQFAENEVNLADRTEAVSIAFNLSGYNDSPKYNYNGNSGIIVTQATVGGKTIDVKADVDATSGKFAYNGSGWHQVNTGTKVTVPSAKGATITVKTYNNDNALKFGETAAEATADPASFTATADDATLVIEQTGNGYWNAMTITLPKPEQSEEPSEDSSVLFSWEGNADGAIISGGTVTVADKDGVDITTDFVNIQSGAFYAIKIDGKKDFTSGNVVTITLDNELKAGDKIAITAFRNKDAADKKSGLLAKFDKGGQINTASTGLEFVNINAAVEGTDEYATAPNTLEYEVPAAAAGSKVISMTRAETATNLWIAKFVITSKESGEEPGEDPEEPAALAEDITAIWDFTDAEVANAAAALSQSTEAGTIESNGLKLTIEANGKTIRNNGNSIQTGDGVVFKVPVQGNKDIVTVVGYAAPYFAYSIGGIDAEEATTEYKAKAADVAQGYVEVVNKGQYLISIKVEQKSPLQEKMLYSTDFSDWTATKAATSESNIKKITKYSKEDLTFSIYNTAVMSVTDTKFSTYTELPHMALQAAKAADPYIKTSKLASVTKVRFIHGATGSNRGWKLEAKGDGDTDWVVISNAVADPAAWSEVTAEVNRTNVELRWTNLTDNQNAYMFELDIYGKIDMSNTPALGTFTANGEEYVAADIFAEQSDGSMAATIELSKSAPMISETNPLTNIVVDNGELGTLTYSGNETACTVTIPVSLGEKVLNYVASFVQKPDFTLTYYNTDGTSMGTQLVEKDAAIGTFAYDFNTATAAEGQKVRGWFVAADGGRKFTTAEVITANTALYAVQTPVEVQSPNERYIFTLNDQYFYAEDHEAFEPVGNGKYHDGTHGWVFGNGDKVNLLVGGTANIVLYLCNYSSETAITLTNAEGAELTKIENAKAATDGAISTLKYEGEAGTVTINFNGTCYLHKLVIANQSEPLYTYDSETSTYTVMAGKASGLLGALDEANGTGNVNIYLPNGTYDLGNECLTTISAENITIKGESQEGVIIQNLPKIEGIGVTATLLNTSNYLTLQNLTLKNAYPYYDPKTGKAAANAGRAVCLQDKGNYTVCRNVTMLSYQDTYYSNNSDGQFYFGNCDIHGLVDFVCGGGDVFYEKTTFYLESREMTDGVGDVTIAAPNGAKDFGYVMDSCIVDCHSKSFNWGRSWGSVSKLAWLNTTLKQPSKLVSNRFTAAGMNCAADGFYEYNTMNEAGEVISPSTKVIKFTHATGNKEYETILTADQAAAYAKNKVFANAPEKFKNRIGLGSQVPTGISILKTAPQDNAIYTLQGVRVEKAGKGIYIINGKKVVIK